MNAVALAIVATVTGTSEGIGPDYTAPKNADGSYLTVEYQSASITLLADGAVDSPFLNGKGAGSGSISLTGLRGQPLQSDKKYRITFTEVDE